MRSEKSFTLIEIMIVIAIIIILAAVAIPSLLRSRMSAQQASACAALKTIYGAQIIWRVNHNSYANFSDLVTAGPSYVDIGFLNAAAVPRQGYFYNIVLVDNNNFFVTANSTITIGSLHYYIDASGSICRADSSEPVPAAAGDAADPAGNCSSLDGGSGDWSIVN